MKKAEYALFAYSALVFVQRFSGQLPVQNAAQLSQQGCLVFGAESAVQQFGQGFFLQTAPAFGFPPGQNGHKGNAVCSGCLGIAHGIAHHDHLAAFIPAGQHGGNGVCLAANLLAKDHIGMGGKAVTRPLAGDSAFIGGGNHRHIGHGVQLMQAVLF